MTLHVLPPSSSSSPCTPITNNTSHFAKAVIVICLFFLFSFISVGLQKPLVQELQEYRLYPVRLAEGPAVRLVQYSRGTTEKHCILYIGFLFASFSFARMGMDRFWLSDDCEMRHVSTECPRNRREGTSERFHDYGC